MPSTRRELLDKYETVISPAPQFAQILDDDTVNFATSVFTDEEMSKILAEAAESSVASIGCATDCAVSFAERLLRITKSDGVLFANDDDCALNCAISIAADRSAAHYGAGRSDVLFINSPDDIDPKGIPNGICAVVFSVFDESSAQPFSQEYYSYIFTLAAENDIMTIADEHSIGFMRTGTPTICQAVDIRPDITIVGGLSGGLPLTLCLLNNEAAHLKVYGAQPNPFICAVAERIIKLTCARGFDSHVLEKGKKLAALLKDTGKFDSVENAGLYISAKANNPHLRRLAIRRGLLCCGDGTHMVFKPPFDLTDRQIEQAISIILSADER